MIIVDNKIQVAKLRLAYIVTFALGTFLILSGSFIQYTDFESVLTIIVGALLIILFISLLVIKPEYIYFSVEDNTKIIVRNYQAFPLFRKFKAIEINIANFQDYELKSIFFNQLKLIRFLISTKNKIGKYPWLNLSAVPAKDIKSLIDFLNKVLPPEKRKKL